MRCATKSLAGLRSMTWMLQAIRNGDVPDLVRPLVLDGHLIGLAKQSQHQRSTSELSSQAVGAAPTSGAKPGPARPPCIWAGEQPDGSDLAETAPQPDAEWAQCGLAATQRPHPRLACTCSACQNAPERADPPGSLTTRPIFMGDVFVKALERVEARVKKAAMMRALAPLQVGIGVPGGSAVASAVVEAVLRADAEKHMLNVDIRNMFNELCRVTMMEDILDSEDFLGEDFSDLAAYIDFAYGEE